MYEMSVFARFKTGDTVPIYDFSPRTIEISAGGIVAFIANTRDTINLAFDNPLVVEEAPAIVVNTVQIAPNGSGDILGWFMRNPNDACQGLTGIQRLLCTLQVLGEATRTRQFSTPGTYYVRSGTDEFVGTIIVHAVTP
jgi:hypothetical protein